MSPNPFCYLGDDGTPLLELKAGLVFYLEKPPSPAQARVVYDFYMRLAGDRVRRYVATSPGSLPLPWNPTIRGRFETDELPALRKRQYWGYGFDDGRTVDSWLFMFHGYRPHREPGKASFYRFSFPWDFEPARLHDIAAELVSFVPCLSGFGGYYLQANPADLIASYDLMFAVAQRYWGLEAYNLDVTVKHMLEGYKCVNWLTIIGHKFRQQHLAAIDAAKAAAFSFTDTDQATVFQAEPSPRFGDVNRQERLDGYERLASALLPIQIQKHDRLGGTKWTAENTLLYIRRFTGKQ